MKKVLYALLLSFVLFGCAKTTEGEKCVTIEVVYGDEGIDKSYDYCTDQEYLLGLLDEQSEELEVEKTNYDFGPMVSGLKGFNFESLGLKYYWSIYVNGEYGMLGISDQPVTDGDVYKFEATSF
ncbi:DUF4430 domain-containing protein [Mycoplasmatota bacterium WC44]